MIDYSSVGNGVIYRIGFILGVSCLVFLFIFFILGKLLIAIKVPKKIVIPVVTLVSAISTIFLATYLGDKIL